MKPTVESLGFLRGRLGFALGGHVAALDVFLKSQPELATAEHRLLVLKGREVEVTLGLLGAMATQAIFGEKRSGRFLECQ